MQFKTSAVARLGRAKTAVLLLALLAVTACQGSGPLTAGPGVTLGPGTSQPAGSDRQLTPEPTGYVFDAADVADYFRSIGYTCADHVPSTVAAGYSVVTCQLVDGAGRNRAVGLVTDGAGRLGNAFSSVTVRTGETYLDPDDALEPLSAFLGTMLGETRGGAAAVWLKEHLGAAFERTTAGPLTVGTYTGAGDDPPSCSWRWLTTPT